MNSYLGLLGCIFIDKSMQNLTLLLGTILMFKQVILNLQEYYEPFKKNSKRFLAHKLNFASHCRRYPETYKEIETRDTHFTAEK